MIGLGLCFGRSLWTREGEEEDDGERVARVLGMGRMRVDVKTDGFWEENKEG